MPEGDTIAAAARLDAALRGAVVAAIAGSHRAARANGRRLHGTTITSVEAQGQTRTDPTLQHGATTANDCAS